MPNAVQRTSRACERCRRMRRRCQPPYPCRQCVAANASCDVRAKARPQRRQRSPASTSREEDHSSSTCTSRLSSGNTASSKDSQTSRNSQISLNAGADSRPQKDTFELLKGLVGNMLLQRHGYAFNCMLGEPPSAKPEAGPECLTQADSNRPPPLTPGRLWTLLTMFQKFIGWQDAHLVDIDELHISACLHIEQLAALSPSNMSTTIMMHRLPADDIALIFAILAIGSVATGELGHGQLYFNISTEIAKHFVGRTTLVLCLTYFLQHVFALRAGTSNYARSIIAQAIHNAHDLGLHHTSHGTRGLRLYLLIYMADQYCSLTHNAEPIIRTSSLQEHIFKPLSDAEPHLQTLIELVTTNGYIIEHSHQPQCQSSTNVQELESRIGSLSLQRVEPLVARPMCEDFRAAYEPLARIHMLCCRLNLRIAGLSVQTSWLSSLCICLHAAEGILSTYFSLYHPVLVCLVKQSDDQQARTETSESPVMCKLPATWRQVKRIMTAALIVIFAYWHGELTQNEASRYMAMARLLLEYPRWRWGGKLVEALQALEEISSLGGFRLRENMQTLLPEMGERFPRPLHGNYSSTPATPAEPEMSQDDMFWTSESWPSNADQLLDDSQFGPNLNTIEDQVLFGLWEVSELPMEGCT